MQHNMQLDFCQWRHILVCRTTIVSTCGPVVGCYRYSLVVENGVVKHVNVEPDGKGLTCSLAPEILQQV